MTDLYEEDRTRDKINVNSPKAKKQAAWPGNLVTQVNQGDAEALRQKQVEMSKRMADKRKAEKDAIQAEEMNEYMQVASTEKNMRPGSCNPCRSCLRCFFKQEPPTEASGGPQEAGAGGGKTGDLAANLTDTPLNETSTTETETDVDNGLLPKQKQEVKGKKCLVLDLDETLVHSSFQPIECSFSVPIEIDGIRHEVYVLKRPFVDEFLKRVAKHFELVVFTASLSEYANPVLDILDQDGLIAHRLFRESCVLHEGQAYVKDLGRLGRKLKDCIIVDNSPLSYLYDPTNAIGCTSWFGDPHDTELLDMCPILIETLAKQKDVRQILNANIQTFQFLVENYGGDQPEKDEDQSNYTTDMRQQ